MLKSVFWNQTFPMFLPPLRHESFLSFFINILSHRRMCLTVQKRPAPRADCSYLNTNDEKSSGCSWQQVHQDLWCVLLFRVVAMMPQLCQMSALLKSHLAFTHLGKEGEQMVGYGQGSPLTIPINVSLFFYTIKCFTDAFLQYIWLCNSCL